MFPLETPGEGPSRLLQLLVPHVSLGLWPHHPISASVVMWLLSLRVSVSSSLWDTYLSGSLSSVEGGGLDMQFEGLGEERVLK